MLFKKLDLEKRNELRKVILKELETVPEGKRIKLDTKLLDDLIFFKFKDTKTKEQYKKPVWTGEFLRKLDLSTLSFKNVSLIGFDRYDQKKTTKSTIVWKNLSNMSQEDAELYVEEYHKCNDKKTIESQYTFDFSYTNIKLNIDEIATEANATKIYRSIMSCNLEGIDLSKSNYENCCFQNCNLKDTNINDITDGYFSDNDYTNNDFSDITVDEIDDDFVNNNTKYCNTGLKLQYKFTYDTDCKDAYECLKRNGLMTEKPWPMEYDDIVDYYKKADKDGSIIIDSKHLTEEEYKVLREKAVDHAFQLYDNQNFVKKIKKGDFDGCYLNGKLIDSKTINAEPESYEDLMTSITSSIEEQKRNFGK